MSKLRSSRLDEQVGPSKKHGTREVVRRRQELTLAQMVNKKGKEGMGLTFKVCSEIEQITDLKCVMEERILDSQLAFTLREFLGIAKKEFHDVIVDFMKRGEAIH